MGLCNMLVPCGLFQQDGGSYWHKQPPHVHQQLEVLVFLLQEQIEVLPIVPCTLKCMSVQKESTSFSKLFMDL